LLQIEKAKEAYDRGLALAPNDTGILTTVGTFYVGMKDLNYASKLFEKVGGKLRLTS